MTTAEVKAELALALPRARELTASLRAVKRPLRVMSESPDLLGDIAKTDAAQAIAITNAQLDRNDGSMDAYSNREGTFFVTKPLEVIAVVRGQQFGQPALHLVYSFDLTWYIEASEIAEEFIEYALTLNDPRISWSG